jgi:hypothetical protein
LIALNIAGRLGPVKCNYLGFPAVLKIIANVHGLPVAPR